MPDIIVALIGMLVVGAAVGYVIGFAGGREFQADVDDALIDELRARVARPARTHVTRSPR